MTVLLLVLAYLCAVSSIVGGVLGYVAVWATALTAALLLGVVAVVADALPRRPKVPKTKVILCRGSECRRGGYEDQQEVSDDAERTGSAGRHQESARRVRVDAEGRHAAWRGREDRQRGEDEGGPAGDGTEGRTDAEALVDEAPTFGTTPPARLAVRWWKQ